MSIARFEGAIRVAGNDVLAGEALDGFITPSRWTGRRRRQETPGIAVVVVVVDAGCCGETQREFRPLSLRVRGVGLEVVGSARRQAAPGWL